MIFFRSGHTSTRSERAMPLIQAGATGHAYRGHGPLTTKGIVTKRIVDKGRPTRGERAMPAIWRAGRIEKHAAGVQSCC